MAMTPYCTELGLGGSAFLWLEVGKVPIALLDTWLSHGVRFAPLPPAQCELSAVWSSLLHNAYLTLNHTHMLSLGAASPLQLCGACPCCRPKLSHPLLLSAHSLGHFLCAHLPQRLALCCGCSTRACAVTQPHFIFGNVLKTDSSLPTRSRSQVPEAWVEADGFLAGLLSGLL